MERMFLAIMESTWDKPGFDDAKWDPVVDRGPIDKDLELCPYPSDNISRYLIDPAIIESKGDGIYWIDLGKEIIGGLHLKINSPSMKQITLYYGEEGNRKTGDVQWKMNTGNQYCEHWTLKKGEQIIENIGMLSFRYFRLENCQIGRAHVLLHQIKCLMRFMIL